MKNFKKLLIINHISGKGIFKGMFIAYLFFIGMAFANHIGYLDDEIVKLSLMNQIVFYFFIFTCITLLVMPLGKFNKKLLLSYPLDSVKSYSLSILTYNIFIVLTFYLVVFIFALILGDDLFFNSYIWIIDLMLLTTIAKSMYENKLNKLISIMASIFIVIPLLSYFMGVNLYLLVFYESNTHKILSLILLIILSLIFIFNAFTINNEFIEVRNKISRDDEEIKYEKTSKSKFILRLKTWPTDNKNNAFIIGVYSYFLLASVFNAKTVESRILACMVLIPVFFIAIYDSCNIHDFLIGLPINLTEFHLKERKQKLFIFIILNLIVAVVLKFILQISITENIPVYINGFFISMILYSLYELIYVFSGLNATLIALTIFNINIGFTTNYFNVTSLKVIIFFAVVAIILFVLSFIGTVKYIESGVSILPPLKKSM
ncbi:hypothetical protein [Anaerosphaera multitolerans]|uniref:Uncharacterized protein n=1 Tax=Anaerosphaera multitolerans TaxID=2487351 RepID=A0A437S6C2_9FIRM|nr:hypothetical protein [Anaerosphaera multitolerans]RVU54546.1 hypothetical protein EF514_07265 [Anaerosphaera multitolerans]